MRRLLAQWLPEGPTPSEALFSTLMYMMFAGHAVAKLVSTALAVAALGLIIPGGSAADSTDEAFLRSVSADALSFDNPDGVIATARLVCGSFSAGMAPASVQSGMLKVSPLTPGQAALFMADAVRAYCPKYGNLLYS